MLFVLCEVEPNNVIATKMLSRYLFQLFLLIGSSSLGRAFAVSNRVRSRAGNRMSSASAFKGTALKIRGGSDTSSFTMGMSSNIGRLGQWYASQLASRPIVTKSVTAAIIFAASDASAQKLEKNDEQMDVVRTVVSGLIGLLYFGPAAHAWCKFFLNLTFTGDISFINFFCMQSCLNYEC